jgi:hypothetical protein
MPTQFPIQPQEQSEWCWAAVAQSLDQYFNPNLKRTQCQIATLLFSPTKCCDDAEKCNLPKKLIDVLRKINRFRSTSPRALLFEEVTPELDGGRPVCARIKWNDGGAHFVVITGYEVLQSGARHLEVADPFYPSAILDYDEFANNYHGDGVWTDTYLVTDSSKKF